jgi:hypothetical protein
VNRALTVTLGAALAILGGLCVWQWKREAGFRAVILDYHLRLDAEVKAHADARLRLTALEAEVTRLAKLRDDTEAKYLETLASLQSLQADWGQRGLTIDALSRLAAAAPAVENQNAAIAKQNELLRAVTAERDAAIQKLNARTREFNELTVKYNRLAR